MRRFFMVLAVVGVWAGISKADLIDSLGEGSLVFSDTVQNVLRPIPSVRSDLTALVNDGIAYGKLTQTFVNPFSHSIEATYIFPLPENGAVHGMCAVTSSEVLWGEIKKKETAQAIYDSAKAEGRTAALLIQDRPNIFQQKIANIAPGDTIQVVISCSWMLKYVMGQYELSFPTVVGPRFNPGVAKTAVEQPLYLPPQTRSGASLSIHLLLSTGYTTANICSPSHPVAVSDAFDHMDEISSRGILRSEDQDLAYGAKWIDLAFRDEIPNKDFILRFERQNKSLDFSFAAFKNPLRGDTGYFALTIFPSHTDTAVRSPVELVIMVDRSGSQAGAPLDKAREVSLGLIGKLEPGDLFNVMDFENYVSKCFPASVTATVANVATARSYLQTIQAAGGTMMAYAVDSTLKPAPASGCQKIVVFLTDGYVGNDQEILRQIQNKIGATKFFSIGTGNSVNRYLIEEMARVGNGQSYIVTLNENAGPLVEDFWSKIEWPQLKAIQLDFGAAQVFDLVPATVPNLYKGQPLMVLGRYKGNAQTTITVNGSRGGAVYTQALSVNFAPNAPVHRALPKVWAREVVRRIELDPLQKEHVTEIGLSFSVLTKYTAFVAVSKGIANENGAYESISVPSLWPDGVPLSAGGEFYAGLLPAVPPAASQPTGGWGATEIELEPAKADMSGFAGITVALKHLHSGLQISVGLGFPMNGTVRLEIFDIFGRSIRMLSHSEIRNGRFEAIWDGQNQDKRVVKKGVYILRISVGNQVFHKAVTLVH